MYTVVQKFTPANKSLSVSASCRSINLSIFYVIHRKITPYMLNYDNLDIFGKQITNVSEIANKHNELSATKVQLLHDVEGPRRAY